MIIKRSRALDRWVELLLNFGAASRGRAQSVVVSRVKLHMGNHVLVFKGIEALLHAGLWIILSGRCTRRWPGCVY
jgi:hypothetical protein